MNHTRVLHRKKSLWHDNIERNGQCQRAGSHEESHGLMVENPLQRPAVKINHALENPLRPLEEPPARLLGFFAQKPGAHHRRERQRNDRGHEDGDGQGDSKLPEEPPHNVAHEQERNQYRHQRNRERDDGEPDLLRAFQGRLQRLVPLLDVADDVLNHDDGIVHHETGGNGQRHERQIVDAVAQQIHDGEGSDQRKRHRHAGNDRRRQIAQEDKDHHHHQRHR